MMAKRSPLPFRFFDVFCHLLRGFFCILLPELLFLTCHCWVRDAVLFAEIAVESEGERGIPVGTGVILVATESVDDSWWVRVPMNSLLIIAYHCKLVVPP